MTEPSTFHRPARLTLAGAALALLAGACAPSAADLDAQAIRDVKTGIAADLAALSQAARDLQAAAPAPDADGWNATQDAAAVARMRDAWKRARVVYERIEGAIAVFFPEIDTSIDARYDAFLAETGADDNLFDGRGVTGMHAIERILWSDSMPEAVVRFESRLMHYSPARFPATEAQARDFRNGLLQRLVDDAARMEREFTPLALDRAAAFRGVIGSLEEQREKVNLAATAEEESRYASHTLADMRANLAGGRRTFDAFRLRLELAGRADLARDIAARFAAIQSRYDGLQGDAISAVPATWNPDGPSAADLATDYGQLYTFLSQESDPMRAGSLVNLMNQAAGVLGIPELP
jgi:iron uptake system component EfeO